MRIPNEAELLAIWEHGVTRHPIDRALLLSAWARPDIPTSLLPDLPLGKITTALLQLHELCFGARIITNAECEHCGETLEINIDTKELLAATNSVHTPTEFEVKDTRFRVPCSRDLAAIAAEHDVGRAAMVLLQRCCLTGTLVAEKDLEELLHEVEVAMEHLDPAADITLALTCEICGQQSSIGLNITGILWNKFESRAQAILSDIHTLARAYGWNESEILALSPQRRTAYLQMVDA